MAHMLRKLFGTATVLSVLAGEGFAALMVLWVLLSFEPSGARLRPLALLIYAPLLTAYGFFNYALAKPSRRICSVARVIAISVLLFGIEETIRVGTAGNVDFVSLTFALSSILVICEETYMLKILPHS